MRGLLILLLFVTAGLTGCATSRPEASPQAVNEPAAWRIDPRLTLADVSGEAARVEHPVHQRLIEAEGEKEARLLPEEGAGEQRFAVLASPQAILRSQPTDQPGHRDNLSELTRDEPIWLLDRDESGAWFVHASDGYLGWVDEADLTFIDEADFAKRIRALTSNAARQQIETVTETAEAKLGVPYLWGGRTDQGIDCSGLTQTSYAAIGIKLPRDSDMQADVGRLVATRWMRDGLIPGDLLFFLHPRRGRIHHVALYLGDGRFIEASGPGVKISSLNPGDDNYEPRRAETFAWARRVLE